MRERLVDLAVVQRNEYGQLYIEANGFGSPTHIAQLLNGEGRDLAGLTMAEQNKIMTDINDYLVQENLVPEFILTSTITALSYLHNLQPRENNSSIDIAKYHKTLGIFKKACSTNQSELIARVANAEMKIYGSSFLQPQLRKAA